MRHTAHQTQVLARLSPSFFIIQQPSCMLLAESPLPKIQPAYEKSYERKAFFLNVYFTCKHKFYSNSTALSWRKYKQNMFHHT